MNTELPQTLTAGAAEQVSMRRVVAVLLLHRREPIRLAPIRMVRHLLSAAIATAAVMAGAGCGGDDDGGDSDEGAAQRDIQAEAQERAEAIVLQLSDFPNGWRASAAEEQDENINECLGADYSRFTITGEADSQRFATGESKEVQSAAIVLASDQEAEDAVAELSRVMATQAAEDCFTERIEQSAQEADSAYDFELGEIDVGELSFTPPDVEVASVWEIAIPFEVTSGAFEGASQTLLADLAVLGEGDAVATMVTQDLSAGERDELLAAIADRL